jgi:hypothetical protein
MEMLIRQVGPGMVQQQQITCRYLLLSILLLLLATDNSGHVREKEKRYQKIKFVRLVLEKK